MHVLLACKQLEHKGNLPSQSVSPRNLHAVHVLEMQLDDVPFLGGIVSTKVLCTESTDHEQ